MSKRINYTSGAKWEDLVGYSRAVQVGNIIEIAGTTAVRDGVVVHKNDPYNQAKTIIEIASETLTKAGASLNDVIRTRMFITNIRDWEEIAKAHGEFFKDIKPATTLVEVSGFVDPDMLVEIEFSVYLAD